jgi:hypothetical protein
MIRKSVYKAIDTERDYQDTKWGDPSGDGSRSIDEFALYISGYTNQLVHIASTTSDSEAKLDVMRKIAGLCVACFEQHGVYPR